jgi:signal transduction histidine kinase
VLIVVSQVVARRVTAPLGRLVQFVRTAPAQGAARAEVGDDEIGSLAEAFNTMLDRLDESRVALVRSEKLGLAGLFAARVAHDIRNPLSSIKMQTQLLRSNVAANTEDHETLGAVLHDVSQVESVVRDLMDLANPGALSLRPGDLNAVLREALAQLSAQLAYRKIRVELALADPLPSVAIDALRFRQALINVIVNGSEAMHTGGEFRVSTGADGGAAWIRICDDGVGIDPALVERVFDPFVSTKPEGVGLGLVNVKSVVEGHGGGIRLEPRQPRGTCAFIWLPVAQHG